MSVSCDCEGVAAEPVVTPNIGWLNWAEQNTIDATAIIYNITAIATFLAKLFFTLSFLASFIFSLPVSSSSEVIPKYSHNGIILSKSGVDWSVSHFEIVCLDTSRTFARSSCEIS